MMVELHHPLHGRKHAYSDLEVAADEKNGWVRSGIQIGTPENPAVVSDETLRAVLAEAYRQKFGKKPHHKMKLETIQEALK